jgi:uncharacterized membrane protein
LGGATEAIDVSLYVISVWIHIVAATAWVGSMIFFAAVVVPVTRRADVRRAAPELVGLLGRRYGVFGWVTLAILIVTGVTNLSLRGIGWSLLLSGPFWSTSFGHALAGKLAAVVVVVTLTAVHDVVTRPGAATRGEGDERQEPPAKTRSFASWLGRALLLASLAVLFFAMALVRGFL